METLTIFQSVTQLVIAFLIALVLIPILKKYASKLGLLDKPNARKVHVKSIPVIGGLAIGLSLLISLLLDLSFIEYGQKYSVLLIAALLLMVVGIFDDKLNLKASHRLIIQLVCAYAVAASGVRLTSLYGVFGIGGLNTAFSYLLTMLLIAGVVNAFNLIDGIDGLAGLLALVGFSVLGFVAFSQGNVLVLSILFSLVGAILGFLMFNLNAKKKIFLGDGGSLLLGFLMVCVGIHLIEYESLSAEVARTNIAVVFGVFLIPVLDSLRVYYSRMKRGFSPFEADKTHIHHLFLHFNVSHKKASSIIATTAITLILLLYLSFKLYGLSTAIVLVSVLFLIATTLLASVKNYGEWKLKIAELEND